MRAAAALADGWLMADGGDGWARGCLRNQRAGSISSETSGQTVCVGAIPTRRLRAEIDLGRGEEENRDAASTYSRWE